MLFNVLLCKAVIEILNSSYIFVLEYSEVPVPTIRTVNIARTGDGDTRNPAAHKSEDLNLFTGPNIIIIIIIMLLEPTSLKWWCKNVKACVVNFEKKIVN